MAQDDSLELFSRESTVSSPDASGLHAPLADRMRPQSAEEVIGQQHLLGPDGALRNWMGTGELPSLILWGPPGTGKTTLARLLAQGPQTHLEALSAVVAGVKEIRASVENARRAQRDGIRTVLLLDEIHRLNRAQQDVLLPHVEAGTVTLVGATTENPSFEVNAPLLSRCRVFTLKPLDESDLVQLIERAAADSDRGLGGIALEENCAAVIAQAADGDARRALGLLEAATTLVRRKSGGDATLDAGTVSKAAGQRVFVHDRDREEHYNVASAFIKSLRASDPDAALYYLTRMLTAGEDPRFPARRLMIFASEDVGNADPAALTLATSASLAVERIGMPEARILLAQVTTYLACAPKSNAAYAGLGRAEAALERTGSLPVPLHLRNAPTGLMKSEGYGEGYRYPHDEPENFVADPNLPETLAGERFYLPKQEGSEAAIAERLEAWRRKRKPSD